MDSTGIGAATAIEYAKAGAKVVFGDINEKDAEKTLSTIIENGGTAKFQRTDVTVETEVAGLMKIADTAFGGIDTLVTSAGVLRGPSVRIDDFEAVTFDSVIDVNLKGTFFALKHAVPIMGRENGGVILCIASGAGGPWRKFIGCLCFEQGGCQWTCNDGRKPSWVNGHPHAHHLSWGISNTP